MKNYMICLSAAVALFTFSSCEKEDTFLNNETATLSEGDKSPSGQLTEKISFYQFSDDGEATEIFTQDGNPPARNGRLTLRADRRINALAVPDFSQEIQVPEAAAGVYVQIKNNAGTLLPGFYDVPVRVFPDEEFEEKSLSNRHMRQKGNFSTRSNNKIKTSKKAFNGCELIEQSLSINLARINPSKFTLLISVYDDNGNVSDTQEIAYNVIPFGGNDNIAGAWEWNQSTVIFLGQNRPRFVAKGGEPICHTIGDEFEFPYLFCETTEEFLKGDDIPGNLEDCDIVEEEYTFNSDGTFTLSHHSIDNSFVLRGANCEIVVPTVEVFDDVSKGKWGYKNGVLIMSVFQTSEDGSDFDGVPLDATRITDDFNSTSPIFNGNLRLRGNKFVLRDRSISLCPPVEGEIAISVFDKK